MIGEHAPDVAGSFIQLTPHERKRLARLAEVLIPGGFGLPSATEAHTHQKWIDRTLECRPDLYEAVASLSKIDGDPSDILKQVSSEDPARFEEFTFAIAGAYLLNPKVRKQLGYPGTTPKKIPAYPDEADHYLDGGELIAPVTERGPIYVPTPTVSQRS